MYEQLSILALVSIMTLGGPACAPVNATLIAGSAQAQSALQTQDFIPVAGADLKSKMDAAVRQGSAASKAAPFWVAYAFEVRPGIAIDIDDAQFDGSWEKFSGTTVFRGKVDGVVIETRNLGLFLLYDPRAGAFTRAEIYNLERRHGFDGSPVYWLGRPRNEESLNYLLGLIESSRPGRVAETATVALAVHDDRRVNDMLKGLVRQSQIKEVRETAVHWLGHIGGEHAFLSELVRNEREDKELRETAAHAVGLSQDEAALAAVQSLYAAVADGELRAALVDAAANNANEAGASAFLLNAARTDQHSDVRQLAVRRLGRFDNERMVDELMKIYASDTDGDVRQGALRALSRMTNRHAYARLLEVARAGNDIESRVLVIRWLGQHGGDGVLDELTSIYHTDHNAEIQQAVLRTLAQMDDPRAYERLLEIARGADDAETRQQAIRFIAQKRGDAAFEDLSRLYQSERDAEVKAQLLRTFAQMDSPRALDKVFEVARSGETDELREQAIRWLAQKASDRSLAALSQIANAPESDTDVQLEAVRAISRRPAADAVPLLIQTARTNRNPEVRRAAIMYLSHSGDPRALDFLKEVLTK
jgi:HEAT repeat protein